MATVFAAASARSPLFDAPSRRAAVRVLRHSTINQSPKATANRLQSLKHFGRTNRVRSISVKMGRDADGGAKRSGKMAHHPAMHAKSKVKKARAFENAAVLRNWKKQQKKKEQPPGRLQAAGGDGSGTGKAAAAAGGWSAAAAAEAARARLAADALAAADEAEEENRARERRRSAKATGAAAAAAPTGAAAAAGEEAADDDDDDDEEEDGAARPNPFRTAQSRLEAQQRERREKKEAREAQERAHTASAKQRKQRSKDLRKKTRKGQPKLGSHMTDLLRKIEESMA